MIKEFITDCRARGLTAHTIETYRSCCLDFLKTNPDPVKVTLDDLVSYLGELRIRDLQGSTLKGYFAAIAAFYDFLIFSGSLKISLIPSFRKRYLRIKLQYNGENTRQLISVEEMIELIAHNRYILPRTMMLFLAKTGLRRGELIAMDVQDLDLEKGEFRVKPKAKRSNRLGFLDPELTAALQEYLDWREFRAKDNAALWITPEGRRISRNYVYNTVTRVASRLGLHHHRGALNKKFTPHCFRHFFTTHLRRAKMPREFIQELRGDRRKDAVDIYDHIEIEELRRTYLACIPSLGTGPGRRGTLEEWCK
ncbi:MAG: site-specific integrase [Candidatus Methanoperedens sp.]|nr:site-specific integrase [Candidatus Methanoperedens sp.]CAG0950479.1 Tyrosine recombinase XerC [Methanosarcinales archaeon]